MPIVHFIRVTGDREAIDVPVGWSLMEGAKALRDGGFIAECGGSGACGTCHCIVDEAWSARVGTPGIDEDGLLETVTGRSQTSRLACQITVTAELAGLTVELPDE